MITIHFLPFTANGSLITPITFTHSLRSRELWPLRCIPFFPDLCCTPFPLAFPGKWYTPLLFLLCDLGVGRQTKKGGVPRSWCVLFLRADFREGDENSNFSFFRVRFPKIGSDKFLPWSRTGEAADLDYLPEHGEISSGWGRDFPEELQRTPQPDTPHGTRPC